MAKKKSSANKSASKAIADSAKALALTTTSATKNDPPPPLPKDKEELELEKLVFGDFAGFQEALREGLDEDEDDYYRQKAYGSGDEIDEAGHGGSDDLSALHDDELFLLDTVAPGAAAGAMDAEGDLDLVGASGEVVEVEKDSGPKPAWEDSDDERVVVSLMSQNRLKKYRETFKDDVISGTEYVRRLRTQYERVYPVPTWASAQQEPKRRRVDSDDDDALDLSESSDIEEEEDTPTSATPLADLLQTTSGYINRTKTSKLRPGIIDISRHTDANQSAPQQSAIKSLSFHPTHPLLLSSGYDHTLRLYHIDTKSNPPLSSLYFPKTPITTAVFHPDSRRVFSAGRRSYYHVWDLETGAVEKVNRLFGHGEKIKSVEHFKLSPCGEYMALLSKAGEVPIVSATTGQWVATANVDGVAVDFAWYGTGSTHSGLTIANKAGELFEYDLTARSISSRWLDEGGFNTSKIALGGGDKFIAVGSASGFVNVYDRTPITRGNINLGQTLKPIKALEHLVTRIGSLEFSPDGQVLCMASRAKKDALRLVHIPSCSVFSNWPTTATPLGRVECVAWARGGGNNMLTVGNEAGKVRLWEIRP